MRILPLTEGGARCVHACMHPPDATIVVPSTKTQTSEARQSSIAPSTSAPCTAAQQSASSTQPSCSHRTPPFPPPAAGLPVPSTSTAVCSRASTGVAPSSRLWVLNASTARSMAIQGVTSSPAGCVACQGQRFGEQRGARRWHTARLHHSAHPAIVVAKHDSRAVCAVAQHLGGAGEVEGSAASPQPPQLNA